MGFLSIAHPSPRLSHQTHRGTWSLQGCVLGLEHSPANLFPQATRFSLHIMLLHLSVLRPWIEQSAGFSVYRILSSWLFRCARSAVVISESVSLSLLEYNIFLTISPALTQSQAGRFCPDVLSRISRVLLDNSKFWAFFLWYWLHQKFKNNLNLNIRQ